MIKVKHSKLYTYTFADGFTYYTLNVHADPMTLKDLAKAHGAYTLEIKG